MKYFFIAILTLFVLPLRSMEIMKDEDISKAAAKKSKLALDIYAGNQPFEKYKTYAEKSEVSDEKCVLVADASYILYCLLLKMDNPGADKEVSRVKMEESFVKMFTNLIDEMIMSKDTHKDLEGLLAIIYESQDGRAHEPKYSPLQRKIEEALKNTFFLTHTRKVIRTTKKPKNLIKAELCTPVLMLLSPTKVWIKTVKYRPLFRGIGQTIFEKKDEDFCAGTFLGKQTIALFSKARSYNTVLIYGLEGRLKAEFVIGSVPTFFLGLDENRLLIGKKDSFLHIYNENGKRLEELGNASGLTVSENRIIGWQNSVVKIWNKTTYTLDYEVDLKTLSNRKDLIPDVTCCSTYKEMLIVASTDFAVRLFNIKTGTCMVTLDSQDRRLEPKFVSAQENHVAICYSNGVVHVYSWQGKLAKRLPARIGATPVFFYFTDAELYITYDYGATYIWSLQPDVTLENKSMKSLVEDLVNQSSTAFPSA